MGIIISYEDLEIKWQDWDDVPKIHKLVDNMMLDNFYWSDGNWNGYLKNKYDLDITVRYGYLNINAKYGKYERRKRYLRFENEIDMQLFVMTFM